MRLSKLRIQNYRSIRDSGEIRIEALQALVGENYCGKSNCLRALQCFLTSGAGRMDVQDFTDSTADCVIECEFTGLTEHEAKRLRPYLLGDKVIASHIRRRGEGAPDRQGRVSWLPGRAS